MSTFAVQRTLKGITMEQLGDAQKAAIDTSNDFSSKGMPVRYLRSNFYPGDSHCTCIFEAESADAVRQVNETANLPFDRIEEVLDLNA